MGVSQINSPPPARRNGRWKVGINKHSRSAFEGQTNKKLHLAMAMSEKDKQHPDNQKLEGGKIETTHQFTPFAKIPHTNTTCPFPPFPTIN